MFLEAKSDYGKLIPHRCLLGTLTQLSHCWIEGAPYGRFPPAGTLRPSTPQPSSEGAVWPSSVTARLSTADYYRPLGQGLSRMAIAVAAM